MLDELNISRAPREKTKRNGKEQGTTFARGHHSLIRAITTDRASVRALFVDKPEIFADISLVCTDTD